MLAPRGWFILAPVHPFPRPHLPVRKGRERLAVRVSTTWLVCSCHSPYLPPPSPPSPSPTSALRVCRQPTKSIKVACSLRPIASNTVAESPQHVLKHKSIYQRILFQQSTLLRNLVFKSNSVSNTSKLSAEPC